MAEAKPTQCPKCGAVSGVVSCPACGSVFYKNLAGWTAGLSVAVAVCLLVAAYAGPWWLKAGAVAALLICAGVLVWIRVALLRAVRVRDPLGAAGGAPLSVRLWTAAALAVAVAATAGGFAAYDRVESRPATATPPAALAPAGPTGPARPFEAADAAHLTAELARRDVGRILLKATHPTGTFSTASGLSVIVVSDGRVRGQVAVGWVGLSGAGYATSYRFTIGGGRADVEVLTDSAVYKISAEGLGSARDALTALGDDLARGLPPKRSTAAPAVKGGPAASRPPTTGAEALKELEEIGKQVRQARTMNATTLLLDGKFDEAIREFDAILAETPQDVYALNGRGYAHARKGDLTKAFADLDASVRARPEWAPTYRLRGQALFLRKEYRAAHAEYASAIRLDPKAEVGLLWFVRDPFSAHLERALVRIELGEFEGAVGDCDAELRLNPNSYEGYGTRAVAHRKLGNDAAAKADAARALELRDVGKKR